MNKKYITIFLCLFFPIILSSTFSNNIAFATENSENNETDTETIDTAIDGILGETDLSEYENFLDELGVLSEEYSISSLLNAVFNNNSEFNFSYFLSYVLKCFLGDVKGLVAQLLVVVIVVVILSILNNLTSGFAKTSTKKLVYIACYGTVITVIGIIIGNTVSSATTLINNVSKFSDIVFPILMTLVTAIGATATASIYQPLILIFSTFIVKIINYLVMPCFFISVVFNVIGNLSDDLKLSKFADTAKSISNWVIGTVFGIFITYTTTQGITGASIDSLASKGAKYALGSYVPVIGGYLKDGFDLITASCIVIKNSLGLVSITLLLLFGLIPIVKIATSIIMLKLTSAICEPFGDKKIGDMLTGISKSLTVPLISCLGVIFSILIVIMLIILTCNRGVI